LNQKSLIIIGAGLAGLSTGCYAQKNKYQTQIFEHHTNPGGVAAVWKKGPYLIDGGIHFLFCHKPGTQIYNLYNELGAADTYETKDMTTYLRFIDEQTNQQIDITQDLTKLENDLTRLSPQDQAEIKHIIKEIHWMKKSPLLTDLGMSANPPELKTRLDTLKETYQMRGFMKYFIGKYSKTSEKYAENLSNPFLQKVITNLFSPETPFWFALMILAILANGQLGLFKNGCHEFVNSIAAKYNSLGGVIHYNSKVDKILVQNNTAKGIKLANGETHHADIIVSAADGRSTIYELLEGKYVDQSITTRYQTWKPYDPIITISLGVARTFKNQPPMIIHLLKNPIQIAERQINCLPIKIFNYGENFAPKGKTVIQVMLETDWNHWHTLRQNQEEYNDEKKRTLNTIIHQLESIYPDISKQIEMTDIATPYTTWRYTLNDKGSPMGWLLTKKTLMEQIPRTLPGLKNFYMAGHWVLPGGGVPATIYTGRNVIQILCKRDKKEFKTQ